MNLFSLLIASLFITTLPLPARALPQKTMDLHDTLRAALDYSPDIKKAQSQVNQAGDTYDKAASSVFPTINASGSALARQNATTSTSSSSGTTTTTTGGSSGYSNIYNAAISLSQPLYAGGAIDAGKGLYSTQETIAKLNLFSIKQTAALNIITSFYSLAQAQELTDSSTQNRDILQEYLKVTEYYDKIGRSRDMDKLQAEANYSLSLADVEQNQNSLKQAQANLRKLIGGDTNQVIIKADYSHKPVDYKLSSPDEAYKIALQKNPDILVSQLSVNLVDYNKELDLSQDRPSLNLIGSMGYQNTDPSLWFQPSTFYYSGGLSLTIPLFSGFSSVDKKHIYSEESYQAKRDQQNTRDSLKNQIEDAILNVQSAMAQYELVRNSAKQAQRALTMAVKGYKQGTASSADVTNLQNTRYATEKQFVTTLYSYLSSIVALEKLEGLDLTSLY